MRECIDCKEVKTIEARDLCRNCYARHQRVGDLHLYKKNKVALKRDLKQCKECGGKHHAQELCRKCYTKQYYSVDRHILVAECAFCENHKKIHCQGMCKACYTRAWKNGGEPISFKKRVRSYVICCDCGEYKVLGSQGRCKNCYQKWHRANNPDLYKDYQKRGNSKPGRREKLLEHKRKRRSRKKGLLATLTSQEWIEILQIHNHSCVYCGISGIDLHQEHWIPLSKGGEYTAKNIVPACRSCNSRKRTMTGDEFLDLLKREREYAS